MICRATGILTASFAFFALAGSVVAHADEQRHHALSLIGEPQYGPDFKHFDWVNPDAPKGGTLRIAALGSFDSFNAYSIKGEVANGVGALLYDTLMDGSLDEPSTAYGLIAEWVSYPDDISSVTFKLRDEAKFQDGEPIKVEDVIFSFKLLKKINPSYNKYYKNVVSAEKTGDRKVTFSFDMKGNRELPLILGDLPVLPKHYYDGKGKNGKVRDPEKTTMTPPLGSGPYRVKDFKPGREVTFELVDDYWAKDLPVRRGLYNIDEIRFIYFKDRTPAFEAFLSGQIDFWPERSANAWATRYNTDAVTSGKIRKEELAHGRVAPMQSFVFNTRRDQFKDPRVRRALNLAFNFEELNKSLFYNMYQRVGSFFDNSELKASGLPQGKELELLEKFRDRLPPEVFTKAWENPVVESSGDFRKNLRAAMGLLREAGWQLDGGRLVNAEGKQMSLEFLIFQDDWKKISNAYSENLKKLGIDVRTRLIDSAQYTRRLETFDFDAITAVFSQSHSPGNEQRGYWGSAAAETNGSRNVIGIKNEVIDELIEELVRAQTREDVVAATRALDRVLLWNHYLVPQWHVPYERLASWDIFGRPEKLPSQSPGAVLATWWIDADKAANMNERRGM